MVTARKPAKKHTARRETLAEMFDRVLAEPVGAPFPRLTKRQARYFLKRLAGSAGPDAPRGDEVVKRFYGLRPDGTELPDSTK